MLCWGEQFAVSFQFRMLAWIVSLHSTWLVNSAAHLWGSKPYDSRMNPSENKFVSWAAVGEGFHNYHHAFPWDYKTAESSFYLLNYTSFWIDLAAKYGFVFDCKTASKELVNSTMLKFGDGSHPESHGTETKERLQITNSVQMYDELMS